MPNGDLLAQGWKVRRAVGLGFVLVVAPMSSRALNPQGRESNGVSDIILPCSNAGDHVSIVQFRPFLDLPRIILH